MELNGNRSKSFGNGQDIWNKNPQLVTSPSATSQDAEPYSPFVEMEYANNADRQVARSRPKQKQLSSFPTEIVAEIIRHLDSNSAVALALNSKEFHAFYYFTFPVFVSQPLDRISEFILPPEIIQAVPSLYRLLSDWMGPNYRYNRTTRCFLNINTYGSQQGSKKETELMSRYVDYFDSNKQLPKPHDMSEEEWREAAETAIATDPLRQFSWSSWTTRWNKVNLFRELKRESQFLKRLEDGDNGKRKKRHMKMPLAVETSTKILKM